MHKTTEAMALDGQTKTSVADDTFISLRNGFTRMGKTALAEYTASLELYCRELRRDNAALRELVEQAKGTASKATEAQKQAEALRDTERQRANEAERERESLRRDLETVRASRDRAAGYIDRILEDDALRDGARGERQTPLFRQPTVERRGPRTNNDDIPF